MGQESAALRSALQARNGDTYSIPRVDSAPARPRTRAATRLRYVGQGFARAESRPRWPDGRRVATLRPDRRSRTHAHRVGRRAEVGPRLDSREGLVPAAY